jgi:hypothetical protein
LRIQSERDIVQDAKTALDLASSSAREDGEQREKKQLGANVARDSEVWVTVEGKLRTTAHYDIGNPGQLVITVMRDPAFQRRSADK